MRDWYSTLATGGRAGERAEFDLLKKRSKYQKGRLREHVRSK